MERQMFLRIIGRFSGNSPQQKFISNHSTTLRETYMTTAATLQTAATLFSAKDADLLKAHLQALVQVEFLTIPLYLTAVYSFTQDALNYSPDNGATMPLYSAQQEILSVAIQEMLHLQLASNLCNSFGVTPSIPQLTAMAGTQIVVPHLEPTSGQALVTTIGNLPDVMEALIAIEKPATGTFPPPNQAVVYASIADLYHATLVLLSQYAHAYANVDASDDPHFIPNNNQVGYGTFPSTYPGIPLIQQRTDVYTVANAITDQGEGGLVASSAGPLFTSVANSNVATSDEVLPQFQPAQGTRFARWGALSHYTRFVDVNNLISATQFKTATQEFVLPDGHPIFYTPHGMPSPDLPSWAPSVEVLQASAATMWSYAIDLLQANFANGKLTPNSGQASSTTEVTPGFNDAMLSFKYITPMIWQYGQVINYQYAAGTTGSQAQQAMDAADPLSLFHWDTTTALLRAKWASTGVELNACQGLNACAGRGWGGIASAAGNGACATADLHTCGGGNDCSAQGGCGFLSTDPTSTASPPPNLPAADQWIPRDNVGKNTGGCQTPIGTRQVFDRTAGPTIAASGWSPSDQATLTALIGTSVWDRARTLFAQKQPTPNLPTPLSTASYNGDLRRAAIAPTSA